MTAETGVVIRAEGLRKVYAGVGANSIELFSGLNLTVGPGEMVAIVGQSGTGKSSLLHLLAALDQPTAGKVWMGETWLGGMSTKRAADFRNREIGYVWQFHYLMPEFTALENVAMPLLARGMNRTEALRRADLWLDKVGLGDRGKHRSGELSGGEQQRVSLARALVTQPRVLLADEPTGNLDGQTSDAIFSLIQGLHRTLGITSVLVTHNLDFAKRCDRVLQLSDGVLI